MGNVESEITNVVESVFERGGHCRGIEDTLRVALEEQRAREEEERRIREEAERARQALLIAQQKEKEYLMEQISTIKKNTEERKRKYESALEAKDVHISEIFNQIEDLQMKCWKVVKEMEENHQRMIDEIENKFISEIENKDEDIKKLNENISSIQDSCHEEIRKINEKHEELSKELFRNYTEALRTQKALFLNALAYISDAEGSVDLPQLTNG